VTRVFTLFSVFVLALVQVLLIIFVAPAVAAEQAIELLSPPQKEGTPGDFITHVFKVANNTDTEEICDVDATSPSGWAIIGLPPTVRVPPRGRVSIPVTLHIPETALAETTEVLTLTLRPHNAPGTEIRGTAITKVLFVSRIELILPEQRTAERGTSVTYTVFVQNRCNAQETFDIAASTLRNWRVEVSPARVSLEPGAEAEIRITHFIPQSATPGTTDRITVTVTSLFHPLTMAQGAITTKVADPSGPMLVDERLFHVVATDLEWHIPSLLAADSFGIESALRTFGQLRDDLRFSLSANARLAPEPGSSRISINNLSLAHARWGASWGTPPPPLISWVARPNYLQGLSLSSVTPSTSFSLLFSRGTKSENGNTPFIAEVSSEIHSSGSSSLRLLHQETWEEPREIFGEKYLSAAEVRYTFPSGTVFSIGWGAEANRQRPASSHTTTVLNLRRENSKPLLALAYTNTTPAAEEYGIQDYRLDLATNSLWHLSLRGSLQHKIEYGQTRSGDAPASSTSATLSVGLPLGITLGYTASATRSRDETISLKDETSSSLFVQFDFTGGQGSRLFGKITQKKSLYPSSLRDSSVNTTAAVTGKRVVGNVPLELQLAYDAHRTLTGDVSESIDGMLKVAVPLMDGRAGITSVLELEGKKYNNNTQLTGALELQFQYNLDDNTALLSNYKLDFITQRAEENPRFAWSIGLTQRFNTLIPKATASIRVLPFEDANGNGIMDSGESKLDGISFELNGKKGVSSQGICEFRALVPGSYTVLLDVASVPLTMGYLWKEITVSVGDREIKEVAFPLYRQSTVEGGVIIEGEESSVIPQGVIVKAEPLGLKVAAKIEQRTIVNLDGSFKLSGLYPGEVMLTIELPRSLLDKYELATPSGTVVMVSPGETISGLTIVLRKKEKPVATTFIGGQMPSLTIRMEPEIVPSGSEPLLTVKSSRSLSRVVAVLPSGDSFTLEGEDKDFRGRVWIPENAPPGALPIQVVAEDPTGAKWSRRITLTVSELAQLLTVQLLPAGVRSGEKMKLVVSSLTAIAEIKVLLPWRADTLSFRPEDPYFWEAEYTVPPDLPPGAHVIKLSLERSRGGSLEREVNFVILNKQ